jgi:hypothetical protein
MIVALLGARVTVVGTGPVPAASLTVRVALPTDTVADLADAVGLEAAVRLNPPLPVAEPIGTATHDAELCGLQGQPGPVHTLMVPEPPAAANDMLVGVTA